MISVFAAMTTRNRMGRLIFILVLLSLADRFSLTGNENVSVTVAEGQFVILEGCENTGIQWTFQDVVLYRNRFRFDARFEKDFELLQNYSLSVSSASVHHEGVFVCKCNTTAFVSYNLIVTVPPKMIISVGGEVGDNVHWAENGTSVQLICVALHAKPAVHLSLDVDGTLLGKSVPDESAHQNTSIVLTYTPEGITDAIRCLAQYVDEEIGQRFIQEVTINNYVLPNISLTANGIQIPPDYQNVHNEEMIIICRATRARPTAGISCSLGNETINNSERFDGLNREDNTTFDSAMLFMITPRIEPIVITCVVEQREAGINQTITGTIIYEPTTVMIVTPQYSTEPQHNATTARNMYPLWMIPGIVVICTCLIVLWLVIIAKKLRSSLSAHFNSNSAQSQSDAFYMEPANLAKVRADAKTLDYEQRRSTILDRDDSSSFRRTLHEPPKLELPDVPLSENMDTPVNHSENHYYSSVREVASKQSKMYSKEDMSLLICLKMGKIFNRWTGTITTSTEANKCVVMTTLTESVMKMKALHWDACVKRALELPNSNHLAKIEGIGIDNSLFLITEYYVCGSLHQRLQTHPDLYTDISPTSLNEVKRYVGGILEGVEILHSFGFLQPGLSTKKILLTKKGHCKLYEFCLADDAPKIVTLHKPEMTPSFNNLSPEALFWNEYTSASDIWSVANVIWEILSAGASRFPNDHVAIPSEPVPELQEKWPNDFLRIRNDRLFDCWSQDSSRRPVVQSLRSSFKGIFDGSVENSVYEVPTTDLYTPMTPASHTNEQTRL